MQISSRFTLAVHIFTCIDTFQNEYKVTSDFIAGSTNVNPVIIRKILLQLKAAGLVQVLNREQPTLRLEGASLQAPLSVQNLGSETLYQQFSLSGYPRELPPASGEQSLDHPRFGGAAKVDFFEEFGVHRSSPDRAQAVAEATHILFGDKGGHRELSGGGQQPDIVGSCCLGIVNGRRQFFLDVDHQQQGIFATDQHQRNTTVLLPWTSTRSSR